MTVGTITRTIVLLLALINQVLVGMGKSPLPLEDQELTALISTIFTIGAALAAWWENNSFTKKAIKADDYLKELKKHG
ncbi:MAG: phage holin [Clostridiales bacterium]